MTGAASMTGKGKIRSGLRTKNGLIVEIVYSRIIWLDLNDLFHPIVEVMYAHQGVREEGILEFKSQQDLNKAINEAIN